MSRIATAGRKRNSRGAAKSTSDKGMYTVCRLRPLPDEELGAPALISGRRAGIGVSYKEEKCGFI